jgi:hypothetical protein
MIKLEFNVSNSPMAMCLTENQDFHQFNYAKANSECCQCGAWTVEDMKVIKDKLKFIESRNK